MDLDDYFISKREEYIMDSFEFQNGEVLNDVVVEYMTFGTPKYDENGIINNAIIYCHGSLGNYASVNKLCPLTYAGGPFDKNEFFIISLSELGAPGSCSPSTTKLNNSFPRYTVEDMVNFQNKFLKDKFDIFHVKGIIGNSMGGFVALMCATLYPEYADFIISGVSGCKVAGRNYILSKLVDEIIVTDEDYNSGKNTKSLLRTLRLATQAVYSFGISKEALHKIPNNQLDVEFDEFGDEGLFDNIFDVKYCNDATLDYDIEDKLDKIKSKVLIVGINQDQYFPPNLDAIPMHSLIKDSELIIYDSDLGHIGFRELDKIENELIEFMNQFR
ncbi:alpha/beta fold hydrolase [uncultured Methanobrevibacter sp.]|uniref:alpha/beta fold hydrolase n=1 Tax=uncultured Methanobrevibacter sp. TaxID=253161 RepID=UPI002605D91D|nr:alpha/beta fold hydrolase [uncultured Methanobrevibacter sp.]